MVRRTAVDGPRNRPFALLVLACVGAASPAAAASCDAAAGLSPCFDANSLWLPAGRATFFSLPDTRVIASGQVGFGAAIEELHRPVLLHASSPDLGDRDIHVVDNAVDTSFFLAFGLSRGLELELAAPMRAYQTGAGEGSVTSQSGPPVPRNAVRNPRVALAYSLDDALQTRALGLRVSLEAALPTGDAGAFASEQSFVAAPSVTVSWHPAPLTVTAGFGARLRSPVEFGAVRLGNQGFAAVGVALELFTPGVLALSLEAFGLPPLSASRAAAAPLRVSDELLFPAEWSAGVHSAFGTSGPWTVSLALGSGLPLSSETERGSNGSTTRRFSGMGTPQVRSLLVLRFSPPQ